jgi:hypothetical protein
MSKRARPPFLPQLLLRWFLPLRDREFILGDLDEEFARTRLTSTWAWYAHMRGTGDRPSPRCSAKRATRWVARLAARRVRRTVDPGSMLHAKMCDTQCAH